MKRREREREEGGGESEEARRPPFLQPRGHSLHLQGWLLEITLSPNPGGPSAHEWHSPFSRHVHLLWLLSENG